jgi:hypothetical protein
MAHRLSRVTDLHTFHIPVMGLAYTIDTPLKVARFGISSVVSIIDDNLLEQMRAFHCRQEGEPYAPIPDRDVDRRAHRITAYLNLLNSIVSRQVETLKAGVFEEGADIERYFELLPSSSPARLLFEQMRSLENGAEKLSLQDELRGKVVAGAIDVNIMTKCDRTNYDTSGEPLPPEYADARAALRGFALSALSSSVVFSAGLNPRLYAYCESFGDFFPDDQGLLRKKITLKVSDYRSASVQGKVLAKKGLWVSEFRIESGLNCGGHAFATDGLLLGPILEEFRTKRAALAAELLELCNSALALKGFKTFSQPPAMKITAQGGIGTAGEHNFLMEHYRLDGTGWGSPFLLVPEVTNVDDDTLRQLESAGMEDYFLSYASSPLGVPFNTFRQTSSEKLRNQRIAKGRPGSPCYKKFLSFNSEFTSRPICTASREYQHLKLKQLQEQQLPYGAYRDGFELVTQKDCLCEGLGAAVLVKHGIEPPHKLSAVSICPGPNLAFFSKVCSLREMIDHIYGRANVLNALRRPHMFINELSLYVEYLKNAIGDGVDALTINHLRYLRTFKTNLLEGIAYYKKLLPSIKTEPASHLPDMKKGLCAIELRVMDLVIPEAPAGPCRAGDHMAVTAEIPPPTAEPGPRAGRGSSDRA